MRRWMVRALAASTLLLGVTPGSLAKAADTDAATAEQTEAKRSVSQSTYERLTQAKKHMEQGQYGEAARLLQELLPQVKDNDYETALTQQSLAYVYLDQKRYREAIRAMEAALARPGLPREVTHALRYNLAQVYIQTEEYRNGLAVLTQWLSDEKNPSADVYFLAAVAHHHLKQDEAAIRHIQKAIAKTPKPREDWHLFLLSLYFEHKRYQEAVPILTQLVTQYPRKPSYWRYLTDVYLNLKREPEALATLKCAYHTGGAGGGRSGAPGPTLSASEPPLQRRASAGAGDGPWPYLAHREPSRTARQQLGDGARPQAGDRLAATGGRPGPARQSLPDRGAVADESRALGGGLEKP